jgi:hypothetical protein
MQGDLRRRLWRRDLLDLYGWLPGQRRRWFVPTCVYEFDVLEQRDVRRRQRDDELQVQAGLSRRHVRHRLCGGYRGRSV